MKTSSGRSPGAVRQPLDDPLVQRLLLRGASRVLLTVSWIMHEVVAAAMPR